MKLAKKGFALLCALALTLTLYPPPVQAADNLDPAAVAFYTAAHFWAEDNVFVHAELRDMDGDGQPELAAVTLPREGVEDWGGTPPFFQGNCVVWKYVPGSGVRRFSTEAQTGPYGDITWTRKGNELYFHVLCAHARNGYVSTQDSYFGVSGLADCVVLYAPMTDGEEDDNIADAETNQIVNGKTQPISEEKFYEITSSYEDESASLLYMEDWDRASHCADYTALESHLYDTVKNIGAAASATWGACRLDTEDDTWIVFEAASVERKTVSVNTVTLGLDETRESGYQNKTATIVKARAGSHFVIFGEDDGFSHDIFYNSGTLEGDNRFCVFISELGSETLTGGSVRMKLGYKERGFIAFSDRNGNDCFLYADSGGALDAYTDVNPAGYYAVPVTWGIQHGITNGTTATTFSPNNTCTRAHILTFLWRACGSPSPSIDNPFTDVQETNYYYQSALWAAENGLVERGSKFNGGAPCARAEAVTYLWKLSGDDYTEGVTAFKDVKNGTETAKAVQWAVESGVTNGTTSTTFSPNNTCTRAQIMAFLYRDYGIET